MGIAMPTSPLKFEPDTAAGLDIGGGKTGADIDAHFRSESMLERKGDSAFSSGKTESRADPRFPWIEGYRCVGHGDGPGKPPANFPA